MKPTLTITVSDQGLKPEREYSIHMLLEVFLGISYELNYHSKPICLIETGEGTIELQDVFFNRFKTPDAYLLAEHIPEQISWLDAIEWDIKKLPVLFGDNTLQIEPDKIRCGADLFASTFFMLSRWEEYANKLRDNHDRFPGEESLAYKNNFLLRPVVNEYTEFLWKLLKEAGFKGKRKERAFQLMPTHDVDDFAFWTPANRKRLALNLSGDLLKRGNLKMAQKRYSSYRESLKNPDLDPYFTYSTLMNKAEKEGVATQFYFMAGGNSDYDRPYDLKSKNVQSLFKEIQNRGHSIGIHPSYNTYNDLDLYQKEKKRLEEAVGSQIIQGRQHYLRCDVPETMHYWEQSGILTDSTLYYSDFPGFRCGCCYTYPLFDVIRQTQMEVLEQTLLAMDGCFEEMETQEAVTMIHALKEEVKKHRGDFIFLIHNASYGWMNSYSDFKAIEKAFYDL